MMTVLPLQSVMGGQSSAFITSPRLTVAVLTFAPSYNILNESMRLKCSCERRTLVTVDSFTQFTTNEEVPSCVVKPH